MITEIPTRLHRVWSLPPEEALTGYTEVCLGAARRQVRS